MLKVHSQMPPPARQSVPKGLPEFSLTSGGPLYQLLRRTRLSGAGMEWTHRRVLVTVLFAWVPLLLLSIAERRAWGGSVAMNFMQDVETQVRLLIAVPLLMHAEVSAHRQIPPIVRCFVENGLIPDAARSRFDAAIASAIRLRNSVVAELLLVALVYGVGVLIVRRTQFALDVDTWYATAVDGRLELTYAGWWGALVSMPVVQFLMMRWFFRFFVWGRFQWQVSRIQLNLEPTHPDSTAGLHFVALTERACRWVLLGMGATLAGMIANKIFYAGATFLAFKVEIIGTVALLVLMILGPMVVFTPQLMEAKRRGIEEYGRLGQRYAREFARRWMRGDGPADEPLLGSSDFQSLADLRNGYLVVKDLHVLPFDLKNIIALALVTLIPVAPLLLTTFSVEELLDRLLNTFF